MGRKFNVYGNESYSVSVMVEFTDEELEHIAEMYGILPENLEPQDLIENAYDKAYYQMEDICAHCTGWGKSFTRDPDEEGFTLNELHDGKVDDVIKEVTSDE